MNIRPVRLDDGPGMADLTRELGYPSNPGKMHEILNLVMSNPKHEIFIAEIEKKLAGYLHLVQAGSSDEKPILDIAALMVDKSFRSKGVGNAFLHKAENSAKLHHAQHLRIRTSLVSREAYPFFEHRGFVNLTSQEMFVKEIE